MPSAPKSRLAHLTLVELLIGLALLAVAGFFLVRNMAQAKERAQREQIIAALTTWDVPEGGIGYPPEEQPIWTLLKANPSLKDARSSRGITPLHLAARLNNLPMTQWLLDNGADINAKDKEGETPLHWTAFYGAKKTTELLLVKGADINAKNNYGTTPLHWAATSDRKGIAELLLSSGADVNAKDTKGRTPLDLTMGYPYQDLADLLRAHGAKE